MPNSYFLIPGYGAQGGKAEDIATRAEASRMRDEINAQLKQ